MRCVRGVTKAVFQKNVHFSTAKRIEEMGLVLPELVKPKGNYISFVQTGNTAFLSGHLPLSPKTNEFITGWVGKDLTLEQGYEAASFCALQLIGTMNLYLDGDLDRVKRIVRVGGFVQCTEDFNKQHLVLNGCSDLLGELFQERGVHVRTAVGTSSLPLDVAVETDCIIELHD